MEKGSAILAILCSLLLVINCIALIGFAVKPTTEGKTILVPVQNTYNDTVINSKIDALSAEVLKDSTWEAEALEIAKAEYTEKEFKDIFNGLEDLNVSIEDKEDITSVVVKDSEVTDFDVEDKDATVVIELKVYYEDSDGDKKKAYITVTSEIEDSEVVEQTIEFS